MIWITGNSGAGKTSIAHELQNEITDAIVLDGDELRKIWPGLGFSKMDRIEQNCRAVRLAESLELQGFTVILSVICPYKDLRNEFDKEYDITWIKLRGGKEPSKEYPYEY